MSIFEKVNQRQCPVCKYKKRCPARKILTKDPDDPAAMTLLKRGYCSQYVYNGKEDKNSDG